MRQATIAYLETQDEETESSQEKEHKPFTLPETSLLVHRFPLHTLVRDATALAGVLWRLAKRIDPVKRMNG